MIASSPRLYRLLSAVLATFGCACVHASTPDAIDAGVPDITPDRPGLSVLLPAQSFPVAADTQDFPAQELALDPLDEDPFHAAPAEIQTNYALDWRPGVDWTPGRQAFFSSAKARVSYRLGEVHPSAGWMPGAGRFTYAQENGSTVSIGQVAETGSFWGDSPRLGGLQLTRLPGMSSRGTLLPGSFGLSASVGRVSQEDLGSAGSGGLSIGSPMAATTFRYGLTSDITLESHVQSALETHEKGLGGLMAMGDWGALRLSTTQVQDVFTQSQRSGLGLRFLLDQQQFESTYETLRTGPGTLEQKLGFKHSWFITPQTSMQIGGDRELSTGNYSVKMQFSVPLEVLGTRWWRD